MGEHEIQSSPFDGRRILLKTRNERVDHQSVEVGVIVLGAVGVDSFFDHADTLTDHQGHGV